MDCSQEVGLAFADAPLGKNGNTDEADSDVVAVLSMDIFEQLFFDGSSGDAVGRDSLEEGIALVKHRAVGIGVRLGVVEVAVDIFH